MSELSKYRASRMDFVEIVDETCEAILIDIQEDMIEGIICDSCYNRIKKLLEKKE